MYNAPRSARRSAGWKPPRLSSSLSRASGPSARRPQGAGLLLPHDLIEYARDVEDEQCPLLSHVGRPGYPGHLYHARERLNHHVELLHEVVDNEAEPVLREPRDYVVGRLPAEGRGHAARPVARGAPVLCRTPSPCPTADSRRS